MAHLPLLALLVGIGAAAADSSSSIGTPPWLATPTGFEAVLAPHGEPGGRFVMEGRLIGRGGRGMRGVKMFAYHADHDGLYARAAREYMRLAGVLLTDRDGRYRIISALPGSYGGPPHVHFEAWGRGLGLRAWYVDLFRAPGEPPDSAWGRMGVHYGSLRENPPQTTVTRDAHGVFHAHCDLHWEHGFVAPASQDSSRRGLTARSISRSRTP